MTRKSTVRLVRQYLNENNINADIIEASDGIECLWVFYSHALVGDYISIIISDESMIYMNGSTCASIIKHIVDEKNMPKLGFYIVSAYENLFMNMNNKDVDSVFTKPIHRQNI